jgi:hypothetical protein
MNEEDWTWGDERDRFYNEADQWRALRGEELLHAEKLLRALDRIERLAPHYFPYDD